MRAIVALCLGIYLMVDSTYAAAATTVKPHSLNGWCNWAWQHQQPYVVIELCEASARDFLRYETGLRDRHDGLIDALAGGCLVQAALAQRELHQPYQSDLRGARVLFKASLATPLPPKIRVHTLHVLYLVSQLMN